MTLVTVPALNACVRTYYRGVVANGGAIYGFGPVRRAAANSSVFNGRVHWQRLTAMLTHESEDSLRTVNLNGALSVTRLSTVRSRIRTL